LKFTKLHILKGEKEFADAILKTLKLEKKHGEEQNARLLTELQERSTEGTARVKLAVEVTTVRENLALVEMERDSLLQQVASTKEQLEQVR
jgi:hypothetical protein